MELELICKNNIKASLVCTYSLCEQIPFICQSCPNQECLRAHKHDHKYLVSINNFKQNLKCLYRNKIPSQSIFERIDKQFRKLQEIIEMEYKGLQQYKIKTYQIPIQISKLKERLFLQPHTITSSDIIHLKIFCQKYNTLKDYNLQDYIQLQNKIHKLFSIGKQLSQQLKDLYRFPQSLIRPIIVTWQQPLDNNLNLVKNQINSLSQKVGMVCSKQLLVNGQFQITFQAFVNRNSHFGITKKNSILLKQIKNLKYPLETKDTYSYHVDINGRIYKQQNMVLSKLKGKNGNSNCFFIKIRVNTKQGRVEWIIIQNGVEYFSGKLQGLDIRQGVHIVASIDHRGKFKCLDNQQRLKIIKKQQYNR